MCRPLHQYYTFLPVLLLPSNDPGTYSIAAPGGHDWLPSWNTNMKSIQESRSRQITNWKCVTPVWGDHLGLHGEALVGEQAELHTTWREKNLSPHLIFFIFFFFSPGKVQCCCNRFVSPISCAWRLGTGYRIQFHKRAIGIKRFLTGVQKVARNSRRMDRTFIRQIVFCWTSINNIQ